MKPQHCHITKRRMATRIFREPGGTQKYPGHIIALTLRRAIYLTAHSCESATRSFFPAGVRWSVEQHTTSGSSMSDASSGSFMLDTMEEAMTQEEFENLCTLLRLNDGSITRVDSQYGIEDYYRKLGQALLHNTHVTYLNLDLDDLMRYDNDTVEGRMHPLVQYLQTSSSLKEVRFFSVVSVQPEILSAVAANPSIESADLSSTHGLSSSPAPLVHLLTTTTSITTLKCRLFGMAKLHQVAAAFGTNRTIQDLTIEQASDDSVDPSQKPMATIMKLASFLPDMSKLRQVSTVLKANRMVDDGTVAGGTDDHSPAPTEPEVEWVLQQLVEVESILLQLATHSSLQKLCLAVHVRNITLIHTATIALVLLSTRTLQCLELKYYDFDRPMLCPILAALKENSTVTNLNLRFCTMNDEATLDFIDFVQYHCNKPGTNSVLRDVVLHTSALIESFSGMNAANVAATMSIGSSLQSLNLLELEEGRRYEDANHWMDIASFFTTLLENVGQVRLPSLKIDNLSIAGANAMLEYLPKAVHLRSLTVSKMDQDVDSTRVETALRDNGSLHHVSITTQPAVDDDPGRPFFTQNELRRIHAYGIRNQTIPLLLQQPLLSTHGQPDDSSNLRRLTHLLTATQPAARTAPNNLVKGLLFGDQAIGL